MRPAANADRRTRAARWGACWAAAVLAGCAVAPVPPPLPSEAVAPVPPRAIAPAPAPRSVVPVVPPAPPDVPPPAPAPAPEPDDAAPTETGMASWYGAAFHRRRTASGERFDMHALTAAHRTLPFGSLVCVRSLVNGKAVQVRINDRGPHTQDRVIDLSRAAAQELGMLGLGIKPVTLTPIDPDDDGSSCS